MKRSKNTYVRYILFPTIILFALCNCQTYVGNLSKSIPEYTEKVAVKRDCSIIVLPITDKRELIYEGEESVKKVSYFIPFPIIGGGSEGPVFAKNYTIHDDNGEGYVNNSKINKDYRFSKENVNKKLRSVIETTIEESDMFSGMGKEYDLEIELLNLYGVNYTYSYLNFCWFWATEKEYNFLPTGFAAFKLTLKSNNKTISSKYISNAFLYNSEHEELTLKHSAWTGARTSIEIGKIKVIILNLKILLKRIPSLLDQMLAEAENSTSNSEFTHFKIIKLTREYDFQQEIVIEIDNGNIISNKLIHRNNSIISSPDTWIVSPENDGHWLSSDQYLELIERLKERYDVQFKDNLSAAYFYGREK